MSDEFKDADIGFGLKKLSLIIWHRKYWILAIYTVIILLFVFMVMNKPKIYTAEALILYNNTGATNLTEINPYAVSSMAGQQGGAVISLGKESLDTEIQIIQSPLVLDKVIIDNDLKYQSGPHKGEYLLADHFLNPNLIVETLSGTQIIRVGYKSTNPELAYNVVKSIVKNYKDVNVAINSQKAINDIAFLSDIYDETQKEIDQKISKLETTKKGDKINPLYRLEKDDFRYEILTQHDKRLQNVLRNMPSTSIDIKKWEVDFAQEIDKLKMVKEKYEWSKFLEEMSKNTSNIFVLKEPRMPRDNEYEKQSWLTYILISLVVSFTVSCIAVSGLELASKRVTFNDLSDNTYIVYNNHINYKDVLTAISVNHIDRAGVLSFVGEAETQRFVDNLRSRLAGRALDLSIKTNQDTFNLEVVEAHQYLIILVKFNKTYKETLQSLRKICKESNKIILKEYLYL
jgi:capsular polysaccharide biosynthesis protein